MNFGENKTVSNLRHLFVCDHALDGANIRESRIFGYGGVASSKVTLLKLSPPSSLNIRTTASLHSP